MSKLVIGRRNDQGWPVYRTGEFARYVATFDTLHAAECFVLADGCEHDSADGIDQTPVGDPSKVWRCHECDGLYVTGRTGRESEVDTA